MAITDIQISEELETNAPSIKYTGDEGPKSPQEMEMMADAILKEEYEKYVYDLLEQRPDATPMSLEEFKRMVMNDQAKGPILPSPEDPVNPFGPKPQGPTLPNRQMAAYGGIMGLDGRRQYGFGSKLKKTFRKIIPNEVAKVAEVAAPFVAPFNPLAAGLMKGIGGFDRTGSIGDSLKSGLMTYGGGQLARGIGGGMDNLQGMSFKVPGGGEGLKAYFSNPIQGEGGLSALLNKTKAPGIETISGSDYGQFKEPVFGAGDALGGEMMTTGSKVVETAAKTKTPTGILKTIKDFALDNKLLTGLAAGTLGATALMGNMEPEELQDLQRGEGLDIEGIRAEVIEAFKDPSGEKLAALRSKYPFLGTRDSKNISAMAMGGRIGKAEGGIMDLGGMEKDYRAEGGFVPIGREEKADDVPARLSVNEFVFTADAVRNAGGGDIDKGAEVMENMMKHLEQGGQVSDESQGMAGAQQMFETSERLSEVI